MRVRALRNVSSLAGPSRGVHFSLIILALTECSDDGGGIGRGHHGADARHAVGPRGEHLAHVLGREPADRQHRKNAGNSAGTSQRRPARRGDGGNAERGAERALRGRIADRSEQGEGEAVAGGARRAATSAGA